MILYSRVSPHLTCYKKFLLYPRMPFVRNWDASCPLIYSQWEANGATWTVQDLRPEDDGVGTKILLRDFLPEEVLCSSLEIHKSPADVKDCYKFWHDKVLSERTSLACYHEKNGVRTLAGLNACIVQCQDKENDDAEGGKKWLQVIAALDHLTGKVDVYKLLGVDKLLYGYGLVVKKEFRGAGIGRRLLEAREVLCRAAGVHGTASIFSGPVSPRLAAEAGFKTVAEMSMKQFAEAGFHFPGDGGRMMKYMARAIPRTYHMYDNNLFY